MKKICSVSQTEARSKIIAMLQEQERTCKELTNTIGIDQWNLKQTLSGMAEPIYEYNNGQDLVFGLLNASYVKLYERTI